MADKKKVKKGINPWTLNTYEQKECPDCKDEKDDWGVLESVAMANSKEAKILQKERLAICKVCEHSKDLMGRGWINYCDICGCMLNTKTRLKSSKCPDGRW